MRAQGMELNIPAIHERLGVRREELEAGRRAVDECPQSAIDDRIDQPAGRMYPPMGSMSIFVPWGTRT